MTVWKGPPEIFEILSEEMGLFFNEVLDLKLLLEKESGTWAGIVMIF